MWHSPAPPGFLMRFHQLQGELVDWAEPRLDPPLAACLDATGCPWVLTEFKQGVPIVDRVRSCQLDPEDAIVRLEPLISLMRRAHARGLVHGSIVPGNVMLRPDSGSAYLLDFGLTALMTPIQDAPLASVDVVGFARLTKTMRELSPSGSLGESKGVL